MQKELEGFSDPENYKRVSVPFATKEEADAAVAAFLDEVKPGSQQTAHCGHHNHNTSAVH